MSFKNIIIRKPEPIVKPRKTGELKTKAPVTVYYKPNDKQVTKVPVLIPLDKPCSVRWDKVGTTSVDDTRLGFIVGLSPYNPFADDNQYGLFIFGRSNFKNNMSIGKIFLINQDGTPKLDQYGECEFKIVDTFSLATVGYLTGNLYV